MKKDFIKAFSYKIKKVNDLKNLINRKKNKIILCHGNFDVVHPGHIRHLLYAKSKANILVVSITADKFIKKGLYRPHIPQNLRALNLAALEVVDFVVIDNFSKPINLIKKLKPNFFAKGYEYNDSYLNEDSEIEMKTEIGSIRINLMRKKDQIIKKQKLKLHQKKKIRLNQKMILLGIMILQKSKTKMSQGNFQTKIIKMN